MEQTPQAELFVSPEIRRISIGIKKHSELDYSTLFRSVTPRSLRLGLSVISQATLRLSDACYSGKQASIW
jgi:hypothetical protein